MVIPINCLPGSTRDVEPTDEDAETTSSSSPSPSSLPFSYTKCAGLGGLGFLEMIYLTYLNLSNSEAFCPIGGGTCGAVLDSEYSIVFGVPLPLIGMVAYGSVLVLGFQLVGGNLPLRMQESDGKLILFTLTASMAAASSYFLMLASK